MKLTLLHSEIDRTSYYPDQELILRLKFDTTNAELDQMTNVSVSIFRAEKERDQFAFGFGASPLVSGDTVSVSVRLPTNFEPGIYRIDAVNLALGSTPSAQAQQIVRFETIWFSVHSIEEVLLDPTQLTAVIGDLSRHRQAYIEHEILTEAAFQRNSIPYRVIIFGVGCLVHAPQQMAGYSIKPIGRGFSHTYLHEIVDATLTSLRYGSVDFDKVTEDRHQQGTPTFFVEYWRVLGVDHSDALEHCRRHAGLLFELLGLDRGQKPREFFIMAVDLRSGQRWFGFNHPWYRGNLISDFNPVSTANFIEAVVPKLEQTPFLRLLLRSYAEATAEEDQGIALLRLWTVLELLADRTIQKGLQIKHPNGVLITNKRGNPKDTNAKDASVYQFILSQECYVTQGTSNVAGKTLCYLIGADESHPGYTRDTIIITLWDMVQAVYAIRNSVAHEGHFALDGIDSDNAGQVMAAFLIRDVGLDLWGWLRQIAWLATKRELQIGSSLINSLGGESA
ncbi:hypothetical protein [Metallibacterium scheffleri]